MNRTQSDPVIDEVREVRHRISERHGHDPERLIEYYLEFQERYRDRLLVTPLETNAETAVHSATRTT